MSAQTKIGLVAGPLMAGTVTLAPIKMDDVKLLLNVFLFVKQTGGIVDGLKVRVGSVRKVLCPMAPVSTQFPNASPTGHF